MQNTSYQTLSYQLIENPQKMILEELKSFCEVEKLLSSKVIDIQELAGFIITAIEKAQILFHKFDQQIKPKDRPLLLHNFIYKLLDKEINKLDSDKNPNLNLPFDIYYVIFDLRNLLNSVNNMFKKVGKKDPSFDVGLLCNTYITPLIDYLLKVEQWVHHWSANQIRDSKFSNY